MGVLCHQLEYDPAGSEQYNARFTSIQNELDECKNKPSIFLVTTKEEKKKKTLVIYFNFCTYSKTHYQDSLFNWFPQALVLNVTVERHVKCLSKYGTSLILFTNSKVEVAKTTPNGLGVAHRRLARGWPVLTTP